MAHRRQNDSVELSYFSHPNKTLQRHIDNMSEAFDDESFQEAVRYHDLGKCTDSFQAYIKGQSSSAEPHALVSALSYFANSQTDPKQKLFIANAIASHHFPIKSPQKLLELFLRQRGAPWQRTLRQYQELLDKSDVQRFWSLEPLDREEIEDEALELMEASYDIEDFISQKLLYSRLIYADKYEAIFSAPPAKKPFHYSLDELLEYEKRMGFDPASFRSQFAQSLIHNYHKAKSSIYTITAPTGVGKTLASLRLALTIAQEEKKERIIYAIPFTSIIDQSVAIFRQIFSSPITAHHYRVTFDSDEEHHNDYDRVKFLTISWSEAFIVTTFYQLFFALLSDANSDNIKLQSLHNSVVILDEAQGIPFELWNGLGPLFETLAKKLHIAFILMSATMPIITRNAVELAPKKKLFSHYDRYTIISKDIADNKELCEAIADQAQKGRSVLCVVNTIKNAKLIYKALQPHIEELYCLNSYMLPKDRQKVIKSLKTPGTNQVQNKVLISTQVIEAGVDLDFDVGFREIAPLSSIIQTAGRVNREGKKPKSELYIFDTLNFEIYDAVLMKATKELLSDKSEREILEIVERYFATAHERLEDRYRIQEHMQTLAYDKVSQGLFQAFGLEGDYTKSVALGVDLRALEQDYFAFAKTTDDPWELKSYKERLFKSIINSIVSIKEKDLDRSGVNFQRSELFGLVYIPDTQGVYSPKSGFLIEEEHDELFEL